MREYLDQASIAFARQMRSEAIEGIAASRDKRAPNSGAVSYAGLKKEVR